MTEKITKIIITTTYRSTIVVACDIYDNCLAHDSTLASGDTSYNVAKKVAIILKKLGITNIEVIVKGPGKGRVQALKALKDCGLNIEIIKDLIPIPHNDVPTRKLKRHN